MTATTPNRATPTPQLRPLGYSGAVRITAGPWKDRIDDAVATYLAMPVDDVLHGYRLAAGQDAPGRPMDGWSSTTTQSTFGQWVSGLARIGVTAGVPAASARAVDLVEGWAATLGPDDNPRMSLYGLEKLLGGLVDVALYADHPQSLRLVERLVTWARHGLGTERKVASASDFAGGEHSVHEWYTFAENLHRAWLAGADDTVEEYACTFHYDTWWDRFRTAPAAGQPWDVPVWLHAYSHVNTFASAAAAFEATGEPGYLDILRNAHTWVTTTQTFATGGYGPGELTVPDDGTLGGSLEWRTDSAEIVCGTWAAFKLSSALLRHTGDARYGDWVEQLVHSGLGAVTPVRPDGTSPYYQDYRLGITTRLPHWDHWPCCSGTYLQGVAHLPDLVYHQDDEGLAVLLALPSTVTFEHGGRTVELEQTTTFPESDTTTLTVTGGETATWALKVRVPAWSAGLRLFVNGEEVPAVADEAGWAVVARTWVPGDRLEVTLGAHLRVLPVDRQHPNRVAFAHGPVVLAQPADWTAPVALPVPWSMVDLAAAFTKEAPLRYRPLSLGTARLPVGPLVPLGQIPERYPCRVYMDVDAPRII